MGNKEEVRGFCTSLGCRIEKSQKNLFLPPTAEKRDTDTEAHTYTHSTTTTTATNSWRRRQTRRELISSPTRRVLQGGERERERKRARERRGGIVVTHVWLSGLQAPHPSHSHSLLCHSQRHVSLYLPISPSINLHLPSSSL